MVSAVAGVLCAAIERALGVGYSLVLLPAAIAVCRTTDRPGRLSVCSSGARSGTVAGEVIKHREARLPDGRHGPFVARPGSLWRRRFSSAHARPQTDLAFQALMSSDADVTAKPRYPKERPDSPDAPDSRLAVRVAACHVRGVDPAKHRPRATHSALPPGGQPMTSTSVPGDPKSRLKRVSPSPPTAQRGGRPSKVDEPSESRG